MVSIVLVGHSPEMLRGLRAMIGQASAQVPVATAGGTSIGTLGTSSPSILAALKAGLAAATGDGVVVLIDLGSAFLALEMALEELSDADRALVRVSAGPLVEGAVLAAIEASGGASLDHVAAAADAASATRKLPEGWTETGRPGGAEVIVRWVRVTAARISESRAWLTDLDAAIGDGDHGINLDRGFAAVVAGLDEGVVPDSAPGALLMAVGRTLNGAVGGASGALYARAFMRAGSRLAGRPAGEGRLDATDAADALTEAVAAIGALGRSRPGEKTMLDALMPAADAFRAAVADGAPIARAAERAADAADAGARATLPLVATKGRASYLGERSVGHLDPGAASSALILRALADVLADAFADG